MYTKNKRDGNETEIIQALKAAGASVKRMDRLAGFDVLVGYDGQLYVMEVKSDRSEPLTQAEQLYKQELSWQGIVYHVVYDIEQALGILGVVEMVQKAKEYCFWCGTVDSPHDCPGKKFGDPR